MAYFAPRATQYPGFSPNQVPGLLAPSVNIIHITTLPKPLTKSGFKMALECPTRPVLRSQA